MLLRSLIMPTLIKKFINGVSYEEIFDNCLIKLSEPHRAGDIIGDKILIPENVWFGDTIPTQEQIDRIIYDPGFIIKAISIDFIDDIVTNTDMTPYGFAKVSPNRYCKSDEAVFWAKQELSCNSEET